MTHLCFSYSYVIIKLCFFKSKSFKKAALLNLDLELFFVIKKFNLLILFVLAFWVEIASRQT